MTSTSGHVKVTSGQFTLESIILALQLNRTLCIPAFFKHKSDDSASVLKDFGVVDQSEALIDAKYRIDLDKLKHLMTICDLEKIQSNCEGRIHAVFNARKGLKVQAYTLGYVKGLH